MINLQRSDISERENRLLESRERWAAICLGWMGRREERERKMDGGRGRERG